MHIQKLIRLSLTSVCMFIVTLFQKDIVRPEPPHGECKNFTDDEIAKKNAFLQELGHVKYSRQVSN